MAADRQAEGWRAASTKREEASLYSLMSASAASKTGRAIDVLDRCLVLRHFPNFFSKKRKEKKRKEKEKKIFMWAVAAAVYEVLTQTTTITKTTND